MFWLVLYLLVLQAQSKENALADVGKKEASAETEVEVGALQMSFQSSVNILPVDVTDDVQLDDCGCKEDKYQQGSTTGAEMCQKGTNCFFKDASTCSRIEGELCIKPAFGCATIPTQVACQKAYGCLWDDEALGSKCRVMGYKYMGQGFCKDESGAAVNGKCRDDYTDDKCREECDRIQHCVGYSFISNQLSTYNTRCFIYGPTTINEGLAAMEKDTIYEEEWVSYEKLAYTIGSVKDSTAVSCYRKYTAAPTKMPTAFPTANPTACNAPTNPTRIYGRSDCPQTEAGEYDCLHSNTAYSVYEEAWAACRIVPGCAYVHQQGRNYYLRRSTDPVREHNTFWYVRFQCGITTPATDCGAPIRPTKTYVRVDCPKDHLGRFNCLNDNKAYSSYEKAWDACATVSGCDLVHSQNKNYYLRRASDPVHVHATFWVEEYTCETSADTAVGSRNEYWEEADGSAEASAETEVEVGALQMSFQSSVNILPVDVTDDVQLDDCGCKEDKYQQGSTTGAEMCQKGTNCFFKDASTCSRIEGELCIKPAFGCATIPTQVACQKAYGCLWDDEALGSKCRVMGYDYIGMGYCKDAAGGAVNGKCRDGYTDDTCREECDRIQHCVGYSFISNQSSKYFTRCFIYGPTTINEDLNEMESDTIYENEWVSYGKLAYTIGSVKSSRAVSCYRKLTAAPTQMPTPYPTVDPTACSAPTNPTRIYGRSDCPQDGTGEYDCLHSNTAYSIFEEAWAACRIVPGCAYVHQQGRNYYLRRSTDPVREHNTFWYVRFQCGITTPTTNCGAPLRPAKTFTRSDCPKDNLGRFNCLNDNKAYSSFEKAWDACATIAGCDLVHSQGSNYYLRRSSDPTHQHATFWVVDYTCESGVGEEMTSASDSENASTIAVGHSAIRSRDRISIDFYAVIIGCVMIFTLMYPRIKKMVTKENTDEYLLAEELEI